MDIPQMEKMSKEDIIGYMRSCAKQYVPEWRYDEEKPDAGTALVSIFADMMYDNIKKFNMSVAGGLFSFLIIFNLFFTVQSLSPSWSTLQQFLIPFLFPVSKMMSLPAAPMHQDLSAVLCSVSFLLPYRFSV